MSAYISAPAEFAEAVTPSDTVNLSSPARSLYVGVAGNISVVMKGSGLTQIFLNVPVGIFPVQILRVNATGTLALSLVALR